MERLRHGRYARAVTGWNQDPPPDEGTGTPRVPAADGLEGAAEHEAPESPGGTPPLAGDLTEPRPADAPDIPNDPTGRARHPGLTEWFWIMTLGGAGLLALGQFQAAFLVAAAGLAISAQGADLDLAWRRIYHLTSWITPIGGGFAFARLTQLLWESGLPQGQRVFASVWSGATAGFCMLTGLRSVSNGLIALLFRAEPNHRLRLAARLVAMGLLGGVPLWFAFQILVSDLPEGLEHYVGPEGLVSTLAGYVVLAFAAVGFHVRRSLRATLARLGLASLTPRDLIVIPIAVALLYLVNGGTEAIERRLLPSLWQHDQAFTVALTQGMSPLRAALLAISAGVGEEVTMRGALQPRLGIGLTALLFAALHAQYSWFGMLVIFAVGVMLGVVRRRTSTTAAIAVHALYDGLAVVAAMHATTGR